jgi:hypothetical protein
MATAQHGRNALFYADVTPTADGSLSKIPMLVDWSIDKETDDVETTHTESSNKEYVSGFGNFNGTLNFNDDKDTDYIDILSDGLPRNGLLYRNRAAGVGKRKYDHGPLIFAMSAAGGVSAKVAGSLKFKAAGSVTHGYA